MITEYLLNKVLDTSFSAAKDVTKKFLNQKKSKLLTTRTDIEDSLGLHLRSIKNWSEEVSLSDLKKAKRTTDIFIELDLYVYPRRIRIDANEIIESTPLRSIFDLSDQHIILLGQPGAGKTTSMKYLCQLLLHDDDFQEDRFALPILIRFRDLNNIKLTPETNFIADEIFRILGLKVEFNEKLQGEESQVISDRKSIKEKLVVSFLEEFKVFLILDGFDELVKHESREKVVGEISILATQLEQCTMIVTSRTGDFKYRIHNADEYELCSLNEDQVSTFVIKWLNDDKLASDFLKKIYQTPFADTAIRPLTLAHLCAIYERIKDIPEKPKTVYKKIVNLLLEEWDQQRSVKRESRYAHFEVDRKYEFLSHLAYVLTEGLQTTVFSTRDLMYVYREIHGGYGLKAGEATQVVSELETHSGLFLQSGFEQYEFAHKSLQEFLTAEYLVKLPSIPSDWETLETLANELAIAVAISSNSSIYFTELILIRFKGFRLPEDFVGTFLSRLLIEKPDFKSTTLLELALLTLCTYYIEANVVHANQLKSLNADPIFKEFEKLIKSHHTRSIDEVLQCYETKHIYQTLDSNDIHGLELNKKLVPQHLRSMLSKFPERLCVRTSLLHSKYNRH